MIDKCKNLELSIIVPIYKTELYLKKCIDSILNQIFKNFELILVADGSPDRCGEICDEYAKKDNRIKVIHKKNGGQASARNEGLDIAKGNYIGFVDSDDWLEPNMYEVLYNEIIKSNSIISICKITTSKKIKNKVKKIKILDSKEKIFDALLRENYLKWSVCNKLYKKEDIKNIRFLEGQIYEYVRML